MRAVGSQALRRASIILEFKHFHIVVIYTILIWRIKTTKKKNNKNKKVRKTIVIILTTTATQVAIKIIHD